MAELTVISQPGGTQDSLSHQMRGGVSSGLGALAHLHKLVIKQKVEGDIRTGNQYSVSDTLGQEVCHVFEENETCHRLCCGNQRGFVFHVHDNHQEEVMTIERQFQSCVGCPCCLGVEGQGGCDYPMRVSDGRGGRLGTVRPINYCCSPRFGVFDDSDRLVYQIAGTYCQVKCNVCLRTDARFNIINTADGNNAGMLCKMWDGVGPELIRLALTYELEFPLNMNVAHKALLLASVLMIDVNLYKQSKKRKNNYS